MKEKLTQCISQDSLIIVDKSQKSALSEYSELNNKYSEMLSYFYSKGYDKVILDYYNGIIEDEKLLEEAMSYHEELLSLTSYMAELSDNALVELKSDHIIDLSQIRDWYDEIYTLSAKYSLAETYYQMGKYDEGFVTLNAIPKKIKLNEREKIEHENYLSLFTFKNDVRKSGRTIAELTEDEIEKLIEIAKATPDLSSAMAKGILCFFYDICIETAVETHDRASLPASIDYSSNDRLSNHVSNNNIYIYPNPGNDNITVVTQLENCLFEMYSVNGSKQISVQLEKGSNNINTSSLKRGVYIYRVETGHYPISTGKWVKM
ncbi:T9SS type A sorting domain-containing protein [Bacteroidales bacterium OttesenSCG-928-K03]|nr:T9SS type A sorting domain-containing protein [Bacteroidales bacterium OttesenSCG-928-K03]